MSNARSVARNASLQGSADIVGKLLSLVLYAVMARQLGERGFGEFVFAFSLTFLLITLASGGVDSIIIREVARDRAAVPKLFWDAMAIRSALGGAAVAVTVAIGWIGNFDSRVLWASVLLGIALLLEAMAKVAASVFLGLGDLGPVARSLIVQRALTAIGGIAVLLAGGDIVGVSAIFALASAVALAMVSSALRHAIEMPGPDVTAKGSRELWTISLPIGLSAIFMTVLFRIDTILLSVLKDVGAVGLYGAAYRLLDATLFVTWALAAALAPALSTAGRAAARPLVEPFTAGLKANAAILLPVAVGFGLYAGELTELVYGADFAGAATALRWLGATVVLYGFSHLSSTTLASQDRQRWLPWVTGGACGLNIALNLLLIPSLSLVGCAVATTVTEVVRSIVLVGLCLRLTGPLSLARVALGPVIAALAMAVPWLAFGETIPALCASALAYVGTLLLAETRMFPRDVSLLRSAITRGRATTAGSVS